MIPRHMCYGDVALRLRHATASPSQKSNSAKNLMLPLRGLSCLRQHPHQRRRPLATPRASPPPLLLIPASRPVVPRLAAAGTRRAHSGRYICRSNPRRIFWPSRSTSRRFLSKADLPVTAAAAELNGDNGEHRRNRLRVRSKADQGGGIKQEQEEEPQQEQQKRGEKGSEAGKRRRVVVGMSGGVDSSVVAMLLQQQGYEVVGVFMRNWDGQDETGSDVCTADADLEDARRVGMHLGIPVETVNFSREYWNQVFEPSIQEFARRGLGSANIEGKDGRFLGVEDARLT